MFCRATQMARLFLFPLHRTFGIVVSNPLHKHTKEYGQTDQKTDKPNRKEVRQNPY